MSPMIVDSKDFFDKKEIDKYSFSSDSSLVTLKRDSKDKLAENTDWKNIQDEFINSTVNLQNYNEEEIKRGKRALTKYFRDTRLLQGHVLDIGGGLGVYREWWDKGEGNFFFVHDPGIERRLSEPPSFIKNLYKDAFAKPMVFVEGYGEDLPYRDEVFNQCIIASALDHCLSPETVIYEAYRCLVFGGRLFVLQSIEESVFKILVKKNLKIRKKIKKILRKFGHNRDHVHHFTEKGLVREIEKSGFTITNKKLGNNREAIYIRAKKEKTQ